MTRHALAETRPLLLASIAAAIAFYGLRWGPWPELYLVPLKGAAVGLLAWSLWHRASGDARLLGAALALAALGDVVAELEHERLVADLLLFAFSVLAMAVFLRNRRLQPAASQRAAAAALLLIPPLIGWLLPPERDDALAGALLALSLGAMAASAWASQFPRYRVGLGAVLVLFAGLLQLAQGGALGAHPLYEALLWPAYYVGQLLIASVVAQALRRRDPL